MSAADVLKAHPEASESNRWVTEAKITLYPNPGSRMHLHMECNPALADTQQRDPVREGVRFAEDLLETVRGHVTPMVDMAIVLDAARALTKWQTQERQADDENTPEDPVGDLLRLLMIEHVEALKAAASKNHKRAMP